MAKTTSKRCPHVKPPPGAPVHRWSCPECGSGVRLRALSLTNPYPYLILDLPDEHWKNVENRTRSVFSTQGPLLIHAAQRATRDSHLAACQIAHRAGVPDALLPEYGSQPVMGTVGCVWVAKVLPRDDDAPSLLPATPNRWKFPGHVGYLLTRRVKLPFREMPGGQGIFHVDLTLEEQETLIDGMFL